MNPKHQSLRAIDVSSHHIDSNFGFSISCFRGHLTVLSMLTSLAKNQSIHRKGATEQLQPSVKATTTDRKLKKNTEVGINIFLVCQNAVSNVERGPSQAMEKEMVGENNDRNVCWVDCHFEHPHAVHGAEIISGLLMFAYKNHLHSPVPSADITQAIRQHATCDCDANVNGLWGSLISLMWTNFPPPRSPESLESLFTVPCKWRRVGWADPAGQQTDSGCECICFLCALSQTWGALSCWVSLRLTPFYLDSIWVVRHVKHTGARTHPQPHIIINVSHKTFNGRGNDSPQWQAL